MALTSFVSNAELSANPLTGLVVGDTDPAATQVGAITKLRDGEDENAATIDDVKTIFDGHDHDPATGTGGGGQKVGTTGPAIAADGVDTAAIEDGAITGGKTEDGAIGTAEIAGTSVELAQIGAASSTSNSIAAGATWTFNHGGTYILFHVECDNLEGENLLVQCDSGQIKVKNNGGSTVSATIKYYAG